MGAGAAGTLEGSVPVEAREVEWGCTFVPVEARRVEARPLE